MVGVLVGLGLAAVPVYRAPHRAVEGLRAAVKARDSARLAEYVDFESLRESLKSGVSEKLHADASREDEAGNPFARFGAALATAVAGPFIDAIVTPAGLELLLAGRVVDYRSLPAPDSPPPPAVSTSMGYEGPNHFVVVTTPTQGGSPPLALVFRREGLLTWRLAGVRLPATPSSAP
ncbi:hypothetical protein MYXO_01106 [Myxococcaceae bacterium]|jgi:hypothetical protein|nr:hypothetical protein MYXO_01106 [Myxococcaceae bacterium]